MRRWTQDEKDGQAEKIRLWRPWVKSTGPQTEAGKMRSSQNARRHGAYSHAVKEEVKQLNALLRDYEEVLRAVGRE
jgi:hypothetical protein